MRRRLLPVGTTLRYDQVPLEDFLICLMQYETDVRTGFLPPARNLKEARFQSDWNAGPEGASLPLALYLLQETDALSQQAESFLLVHAPSGAASALRDLALRLRHFLGKNGQPSLFRIDPHYGLLAGSAAEPVDPAIRWDRPGTYIALYLTEDPTSPSLAVAEYVPADQRKRFQEIFQRYNQIPPATAGLFRSTFKKLMGGPRSIEPPRRLTYKLLKSLAAFLLEAHAKTPTISLIYKDLSPEDGKRVLLDPKFGAFYPNGQDRFVASLGELT
jgi:hypothetical protein